MNEELILGLESKKIDNKNRIVLPKYMNFSENSEAVFVYEPDCNMFKLYKKSYLDDLIYYAKKQIKLEPLYKSLYEDRIAVQSRKIYSIENIDASRRVLISSLLERKKFKKNVIIAGYGLYAGLFASYEEKATYDEYLEKKEENNNELMLIRKSDAITKNR